MRKRLRKKVGWTRSKMERRIEAVLRAWHRQGRLPEGWKRPGDNGYAERTEGMIGPFRVAIWCEPACRDAGCRSDRHGKTLNHDVVSFSW